MSAGKKLSAEDVSAIRKLRADGIAAKKIAKAFRIHTSTIYDVDRCSTSKKPLRSYSQHGLHALRKAVKELGNRALSKRTTVGKALAAWRAEILKDLGGEESVSAQRKAILDVAVRTKLLLDSIDAWLLEQPSLINKRNRSVLPVVIHRQQLADGLVRQMVNLGLQKHAHNVTDLKTFLTEHDASEPSP